MSQDTQEFEVTARAGPRVAGRYVEPGATIALTTAQAEYELREGTIVPKGEKAPDVDEPDELADQMRAEAAAEKRRGRAGAAAPASDGDAKPDGKAVDEP